MPLALMCMLGTYKQQQTSTTKLHGYLTIQNNQTVLFLALNGISHSR